MFLVHFGTSSWGITVTLLAFCIILHFSPPLLQEFYHRLLETGDSNLPRIFGMTASPIKSKGIQNLTISDTMLFHYGYGIWIIFDLYLFVVVSSSEQDYWQKIHDLETLMNSKVSSFLLCFNILFYFLCYANYLGKT